MGLLVYASVELYIYFIKLCSFHLLNMNIIIAYHLLCIICTFAFLSQCTIFGWCNDERTVVSLNIVGNEV